MVSDNVPPRKFLSEAAINLYSGHCVMLPPDQLRIDAAPTPEQEAVLRECHIYLICRRPVLSIDPATFRMEGSAARGHLVHRRDGKRVATSFQIDLRMPDKTEVVVDAYPHRKLLVRSPTDDQRFLPTSALAIYSRLENSEIRAFEVAYVGQAYGDGSRTAIDRLRSHSTLQRILAETAAERPDDEVMLFLFAYPGCRMLTLFDGISTPEIKDERDKDHWLDMLSNPPSGQMQIALAEAGLIRYFEPEYNEIYKESFPHEGLKLLEHCYRLDFAGLVVEIDTEDLNAPIYSRTVAKGYHHIAQFDLHDPRKRRSFFSILDREGRHYTLMSDRSGPVF